MNTSVLKTFAPAVRRHLLEAVTRKLDFILSAQTPDYLTTYARQVASLRSLADADRAGLIERVAYTWFNRLVALRYLDAKGWHPFRARVLTPASSEETQPELLKLMRVGALPEELRRHTSPGRLDDLLDGLIPSPDPPGEVYRHLVLAACHFYHALLPDVFERLDDETELLLPDDLLTQHSVAQPFRAEIADDDCAEVEIIGWLYQFYISERKDAVMARKSAVPKEDIPAVTQLFTPHWIVRYLVENSLGRLWLLNNPASRLREQMSYYIDGEPVTEFLRITKPEEIRVIDPACGSGHMLTYAFDLLYAIYEEEGYPASDISALILKHNLHGLDICPRAAQLAELALLFKAREKSRGFFQPEYLVRPNLMELREVQFAENELRDYIHALDLGGLFNENLLRQMYQFEEAKNFGSLIQPFLDEQTIGFVRDTVESKDLGSQLFLHETHVKVLRVLEQAEALTQRYHIVVANPPYMGNGGMNAALRGFADAVYSTAKTDLFAMFIDRSRFLSVQGGYSAMVTMQSWMFLSSYQQLRRAVISEMSILTLIQIGFNSFPEMNSKIAQACAFILLNHRSNYPGSYLNLNDGAQSADKQAVFLQKLGSGELYRMPSGEFDRIPGSPIAYWVSEAMLRLYAGSFLADVASPRQGLATGDNEQFLRYWHEVSQNKVGFGFSSQAEALASRRKWFPTTKGGSFRRWYGNKDFIVNWENDGEEIKRFGSDSGRVRSRAQNTQFYFLTGATWSTLSSGPISFRLSENSIFETKGSMCFSTGACSTLYLLGVLNSKVSQALLAVVSPTLDYHEGPLSKIPLKQGISPGIVEQSVAELVRAAQGDWDSFETSWDFLDLPLLRSCLKGTTLEASWRNWDAQCTAAIRRMQELETENNRLFIEAYGLQDELSSDVPEEQITLARADARRDMTAFLSYAVGSMMGRYSLEHPGLILANAGDSMSEFLAKVNLPQESLTFTPSEDGIIPVLDGEWFENDIVARTREFLRTTFGDATLRDNVRFIEDSVGKDLRKYFVTDFYKDHIQTYKKRPIYWMVQSPRRSFSVLIYLHRYTRDTMNIVLNRYLRDFEVKLRNRIEWLARVQADSNASTRDKSSARRERDKLLKALHECEEWERETVLPLAQARIELDLDDGVKANYLKLGEALAPVPGLVADEE